MLVGLADEYFEDGFVVKALDWGSGDGAKGVPSPVLHRHTV